MVEGGNYSNIAVVPSTSTTYIDNDIIIGNKFEPLVSYYITAVDETELESENSNTVSTHSNSYMNKQSELEIEDEEFQIANFLKSYPNPFNPFTNIVYSIERDSWIKFSLFNPNGELIGHLLNEYKLKGKYTFQVDFSSINHNLSSGIYLLRLNSPAYSESIKINYIK